MPSLLDTSLWIDFTRARSPRALKQVIAPCVLAGDAALAEPIVFELLRHAMDDEIPPLRAQFQTMPMMTTPADLWTTAAKLGQRCRKKGINAGSLDLLIMTVAAHDDAELITLDQEFASIGKICGVRVKLLQRPSS